ncbi:MAG: hypothetical protein HC767_07355, partial [Akkermansiaceae bacterium]|nr:hypothetical protein [Akkermansiaceae bacterium]
MTDNGATISVIGLGTNKDIDSALLEDIAKLGKGRIFFSDQPMDIPKIFSQETVTIARSAFIKDPVGAQATGRWSEISPKPIDWLQQVDGYNLSYAREDATVSLVSKDEYVAPLVAHARRGANAPVVAAAARGKIPRVRRVRGAQVDRNVLVLGGHVCGALTVGGLRFRHDPSTSPVTHEIAGHLHPAARVVVYREAGKPLRDFVQPS